MYFVVNTQAHYNCPNLQSQLPSLRSSPPLLVFTLAVTIYPPHLHEAFLLGVVSCLGDILLLVCANSKRRLM